MTQIALRSITDRFCISQIVCTVIMRLIRTEFSVRDRPDGSMNTTSILSLTVYHELFIASNSRSHLRGRNERLNSLYTQKTLYNGLFY